MRSLDVTLGSPRQRSTFFVYPTPGMACLTETIHHKLKRAEDGTISVSVDTSEWRRKTLPM